MPDRNKSVLPVLLAAVFAALLGLSAFGQTTTNIPLHMFVSDHTHMWSTNDPFGFLVLSNLQVQVSGKLDRVGASSTNQTLVSATVADTLSLSVSGGTASLAAGQLSWDPDDNTLAVGLGDGVVLQAGQETQVPVVNQTGATLTNGCFVAYDGTVAASGRVKAKLFVADGSIRPEHFLGMVTSDDGSGGIADNGEGKVTRFGKVRGRNTLGAFDGESWVSNGIPLYASTNRPGRLTQYRPQAPQPTVCIGFLAFRHATQGVIDVNPHTHGSLVELDDVDGSPLNASGLFPVWDNARRVFDFTANVGSFAGTASVQSVRSELLLSNQTALAAASSVRAELLLSNQTAFALAQAASNTAASALSLAGSAAASSAAASNLAASVAGTAASASNTAALAAADAALALVVAYEAEGSAAAAFGLASTYYAFATNAADVASLARTDASNALAIASSVRGANAYPSELWSWNLAGTVPEALQQYATAVVSEGGTVASVSYTRPSAPVWTYTGHAVLTNALTSSTNLVAAGSYFPLSASNAVGAAMPYPLPPVSGAVDTWIWSVAGAGYTNTYSVTAATNAAGGVSVYWSQTNAFTGFLYGADYSYDAYTNASAFTLPAIIDSVTGAVVLAFAVPAAAVSTNALAFKDYVDNADGILEAAAADHEARIQVLEAAPGGSGTDTNAVTRQTTFTVNGKGGQLGTNNAVVLTAADVGAPSIAALYTLMSTSQVLKVWESSTATAWYSLSNSVLTRTSVSNAVQWRLTNAIYNAVVDAPYPIPDVGVSYPVSGGFGPIGLSLEEGSGGEDLISWNGFTAWVFCPVADVVDLETGGDHVYLVPLQLSLTNTVDYDLLNPPETWARYDMDAWMSTNAYTYGVVNTYVTNWMEFGNAGQVWVTDLAFDAAQTLLNGHNTALDPHPGKYVKLTGGAATNLALVNASVGGDTVIGAVAVTNIVLANQQFTSTLYGWRSVPSDIAGAFTLSNGLPATPLATVTNLSTTNGAYVARFVTGQPRFSRISQGTVTVHMHHRKGAAGAATLRPELYILDALGNKLWEYDAAQTGDPLTTALADSTIPVPIPSNIVLQASWRIGVYIKAFVTSGTPDIYLDLEDNVNFMVEVPVPSGEYVTQSQLAPYMTGAQTSNLVASAAGQGWTEVDIGALRASFVGALASVGQLEGTTYGVAGSSNAASACAFGLLSLRPTEESKTNLVLCVCSSSALSLDNQATFTRFVCVTWTNTAATVYDSYPTFTNGISTATLRIPVYRNVSINHNHLASLAQDTARDRTVFSVRYRWE